MPTEKPPVSFRLTEETKKALARAAEKYCISQAAVVEALVQMLDKGYLTIRPNRSPKKESQS